MLCNLSWCISRTWLRLLVRKISLEELNRALPRIIKDYKLDRTTNKYKVCF
jgi:hypothetical protein